MKSKIKACEKRHFNLDQRDDVVKAFFNDHIKKIDSFAGFCKDDGICNEEFLTIVQTMTLTIFINVIQKLEKEYDLNLFENMLRRIAEEANIKLVDVPIALKPLSAQGLH